MPWLNRKFILQACTFLLLIILMPYYGYSDTVQYDDKYLSSDWQDITSVEDVVKEYPELVKKLMQALDLNQKGLESVKNAYQDNELVAAGEALLTYYRENNTVPHLRKSLPAESSRTTLLGDSLQQYIFTFYEQAAKVPKTASGQLNWTFAGPADDIEWAWALNRHHHFRSLLKTYQETGNPEYVKQIDKDMKDWVISSLPYPGVKSSTAIWRGLEVHSRVKVWATLFYNLMDSEYFSQATRLLMLTSLPDHAHYLRNFHAQGNWLTMEISALATIATAWPEFAEAENWLNYSVETMTESMKEQVYPDGVQTELTSHYHRVALNNFEVFRQICENAGKELPDDYLNQLEAMWAYLANTIRPTGYGVLNNDSDKTFNRDLVIEAANRYGKNDWKFIASNGEEGVRPPGSPSRIYKWSGQLVMRSDFKEDAHWAFFDIGPWGSGHQHNDKLHLSITAYGRDLLIDAGRFAYRGAIADKFRGYARGSQGHNVFLIDGKGQSPGPEVTKEALNNTHFKITKSFDYAWNFFDKFNDIEGNCKHSRAVIYVRGNFWIIVDHIESDQSRKIGALWHWHPDCRVNQGKKRTVTSANEKGNLAIIPLGKQEWQVKMVKGQDNPDVQGWYSESYNLYEPNTTTVYETEINESHTFVWLLYPFNKEIPRIKAKILSQNGQSVEVMVKDPGKGSWDILIPFFDSKDATLKFNVK